MFSGHLNAFNHMADDNARTLFKAEFIVRVHTGNLVFNKKHGIVHLANVMIQCTGSDQQRIATNFACKLLRNIGNLKGVLKGTGGFFGKFAKQFVVGIRKLKQGNIGGESEDFFKHINERIS